MTTILELHLEAQRSSLAVAIDTLDHPVALLDQSGRVLHRNSSLAATLSLEPEAGRIDAALRRLACSVVRTMGEPCSVDDVRMLVPQRLDIATSSRRYTLQATSIGMPVEYATVVALVGRCAPSELSDDELLTRFRLTARERQVARLLAAGRSDAAIAAELGISWHTSRRHAERVLEKLGVHARTEVGTKLLA